MLMTSRATAYIFVPAPTQPDPTRPDPTRPDPTRPNPILSLDLWLSPLFVITVVGVMVWEIGWSACLGFGLLLLLIPLNGYLGRLLGAAKHRMMKVTDARSELTAQVLEGIAVVKMYAWEDAFAARLLELRCQEVKHLRTMNILTAVMRASQFTAPSVVTLATLASYVALGNELTLEVSFLTLTFVGVLRFPTLLIPHAASLFFEGRASFARIEAYLALPEAPNVPRPSQNSTAPQRQSAANLAPSTMVMAVNPAAAQWQRPLRGGVSESAPEECRSQLEAEGSGPCTRPISGATHLQWDALWWSDPRPPVVGTPPVRALGKLDFSIPAGALVGIVGPVGAGKSALLQGVLGELHRTGGASGVNTAPARQRVAYMPQRPVILSGSVRENIGFGRADLHPSAVEQAIDASALRSDLARMPAGLDTEIGERGVNLSGGQKARLSFARVLAARDVVDLVLMDDPFASVDAGVAEHMFRQGVLRHLKGRTRLLVLSSHTDFLNRADYIISLDKGGHVLSMVPPEQADEGILRHKQSDDTTRVPRAATAGETTAGAATAAPGSETALGRAASAGRLTATEQRSRGAVSMQLYGWYFGHASARWSRAIVCGILAIYTVGQAVRVLGDVWVAWWSDETAEGLPRFLPRSQESPYWAETVGTWLAANVLLAFGRGLFTAVVATWSSVGAHSAALANTLKAPLSFFQENPLGRILNRFQSDLHRVDVLLPTSLWMVLDNLFILSTALILAVISVPWVLLTAPLLLVCYLRITRLYRSAAREMLRLDSVCKSPLYSHFGQTLAARTSVRAFGLQAQFVRRQQELSDTHLGVSLTLKLLERWVFLFMNLVAAVISTTLAFVGVGIRGRADPVLFGLALVYSLQLMGLSSWTVKVFVELESSMTSFERLEEYRCTPSEGDGAGKGNGAGAAVDGNGASEEALSEASEEALSEASEDDHAWYRGVVEPAASSCLPSAVGDSWPQRGRIEIDRMSLRYSPDLPPALERLTVTLTAGEKVGICGRTGAGKSSIIMALFRMFVPTGAVRIDGVDTSRIPLRRLRSSIAIIPQDPVLFAGSVRHNLDPFGTHADKELWEALERVQLKPTVAGMARGLEEEVVTDGNCRLSQGQGQLLCVARALLKDCRILLLDEATSSIDSATDALVQRIIQREFSRCTVLTVAHRIDTIMHCDRILVMDKGRMVECGAPAALLARPGSLFADLARSSKRPPFSRTDGGQSERGRRVRVASIV